MKKLLPILASVLLLCGCTLPIKSGSLTAVHHSMSYPLIFKHTVNATGIAKTTGADGNATYKAASLTHGLTICGFERNVTYENVELEVEPKK